MVGVGFASCHMGHMVHHMKTTLNIAESVMTEQEIQSRRFQTGGCRIQSWCFHAQTPKVFLGHHLSFASQGRKGRPKRGGSDVSSQITNNRAKAPSKTGWSPSPTNRGSSVGSIVQAKLSGPAERSEVSQAPMHASGGEVARSLSSQVQFAFGPNIGQVVQMTPGEGDDQPSVSPEVRDCQYREPAHDQITARVLPSVEQGRIVQTTVRLANQELQSQHQGMQDARGEPRESPEAISAGDCARVTEWMRDNAEFPLSSAQQFEIVRGEGNDRVRIVVGLQFSMAQCDVPTPIETTGEATGRVTLTREQQQQLVQLEREERELSTQLGIEVGGTIPSGPEITGNASMQGRVTRLREVRTEIRQINRSVVQQPDQRFRMRARVLNVSVRTSISSTWVGHTYHQSTVPTPIPLHSSAHAFVGNVGVATYNQLMGLGSS